ncbi:MAG: glycosyltransferase [Eubacteriales bacterium]
MKIRVAEVITDTNIGGAGRLLLTRLRNTDRSVFETTVILPRGSELEGELEDIGYPPVCVDRCRDRSFEVLGIPDFYRLFRSLRPDIMNAHGCLSARLGAALAGVPVRIYTRHCAYEVPKAMTVFPMRNINRAVNDILNTKVIAVAEAAARNLTDTGIRRESVKVIINGVDRLPVYGQAEKTSLRKKLGISEKAFVCGMCARLEDCKGIDTFLRAARILLRDGGEYGFVIVGKGSMENELKTLARALGISSRVVFTGFVSDVSHYMNIFDLNINCSRGTETSSLSISEGMSIGKPCVASAYGGNPYMVRHGENGFVFPVDDFHSLAQTIKKTASDPKLYRRLSENALLRYKTELNSKNMTRKTEELYSSLFLAEQKLKTKYCRGNPEINQ